MGASIAPHSPPLKIRIRRRRLRAAKENDIVESGATEAEVIEFVEIASRHVYQHKAVKR